MASNLIAMASNLIAMASNLIAMASICGTIVHPKRIQKVLQFLERRLGWRSPTWLVPLVVACALSLLGFNEDAKKAKPAACSAMLALPISIAGQWSAWQML